MNTQPRTGAFAAKLAAVNAEQTYRGWSISYDPKPIPVRDFDWTATHPDYDASWEGAEDGYVDNGLKASAATYGALCAEIDRIIEEQPDVVG